MSHMPSTHASHAGNDHKDKVSRPSNTVSNADAESHAAVPPESVRLSGSHKCWPRHAQHVDGRGGATPDTACAAHHNGVNQTVYSVAARNSDHRLAPAAQPQQASSVGWVSAAMCSSTATYHTSREREAEVAPPRALVAQLSHTAS